MHGGHRSRGVVTVIGRGAAARQVWQQLLVGVDDAPLTKRPEWLDLVCRGGRHRDATIAFRTGEGRRLVLPAAERTVAGAPTGLVRCLPLGWDLGLDNGGLLREGGGNASVDKVGAVLNHLRQAVRLRTHVIPSRGEGPAWAQAAPGLRTSTHRAHVLDLTGGFDEVWTRRFTSKARSNARKAERRDVEVELDDTGALIGPFDRLYRLSVDRWASGERLPAAVARRVGDRREPRAKFEAVARELKDRCVVALARRNGEPVAGVIVLSQGPVATFWRGAMDKRLAQSTGANELLHRVMVEKACTEGRLTYDMGPSRHPPLAAFKEGFGAREVVVPGYLVERLPVTAAEENTRAAAKWALRRLAR
jgi:hypothetical protein